jgi:putative ABC transport system permease protein
VIVDARIARELWPQGAVGQRLALSGRPVWNLEVIGVTEPVRVTSVRDDSLPHLFIPFHRFPIEMALVMKTTLPPAALEPLVRQAAAEAGTGRAVFDVWPMQTYVDRAIAGTRFMMLVLAGFAAAALLLAAIGLYGTLAYLSSQRAREFGVRLALGATRPQILRLVAGEGLTLTAAGMAAGLLGALAAAQALRSLLYGVQPVDPSTLAAVGLMVLGIAAAACLRPAWSASRVDPARTLRAD